MAVFPAYAGMILHGRALLPGNVSVPRIRGDDPGLPDDPRMDTRVFPAYAGMIRCRT